ncbi:hypothetical protein MKX01_007247 [Papaver californicum]|nr:hypothetical protein MKX01_007247 [Papaver californicum]
MSKGLIRDRSRGLVVRAGKAALCLTKRSRSRKSLARTHGFRLRMRTTGGRAILKRRRAKGSILCTKTNPNTGKRTLFSISNISSTIQKFCLNCDNARYDANRVREWITALVNRNVEELILTVCWLRPNPVPTDLFTSESLTILGVNFQIQQVLDFPQSISLPRLKVLGLSCVEFKDMALTQQLFSNCPILEELVLCRCSWKDLDVISFSAPRLKFFALKGCKREHFCHNLRVQIDAPNLVSIEYGGWLPRYFPMGSFPSFVEADFRYARDNKSATVDSLSKFVRMCSNIKLLKASHKYFQIFDIANVPSTSFPTFDKLMRLEVDYEYPQFPLPSISSLFKFLRLTPYLESLVINQPTSMSLNKVPLLLLLELLLLSVEPLALSISSSFVTTIPSSI